MKALITNAAMALLHDLLTNLEMRQSKGDQFDKEDGRLKHDL